MARRRSATVLKHSGAIFGRGGQSGIKHPAINVLLRTIRSPLGGTSAFVVAMLIVGAVAAPAITPYDPIQTSLEVLEGPSLTHPMGTDDIGRDQLTRILYGSRISLYVGLLAVGIGVTSGSLVGLVSGFSGGLVDLTIQRVVDALLAFPGLVLAMVIVSLFGISTTNALLAISIIIIPATSRIVRSAVLATRENIYVDAATVIGASPLRIMFRHILPNIAAPILIIASSLLGGAILIESSLSFLGLGTQPPNPSWGLMLATTGRKYLESAPWLAVFPGLAISITVLAFNLLGDVLRDVLDPRLRGSR